MTLKFNARDRAFYVISNDEKRAKGAGLSLSKTVRGPKGEGVWIPTDYNKKPIFNPYAVMPFHEEAVGEAKDRLATMAADYKLSWAGDCTDVFPVPANLEYMPFQKAAIKYCMGRPHALIGDEPGLGKTIQGIGVANAMGAKRILVVCPANIRLGWQREIHRWSTIRRVSTYPVLKSADGISPVHNYTIISYDLTRNEGIHEAINMYDWDLLILDEAHYLKTSDAQRTRAIFGGGKGIGRNPIADKAKKIVALTGTPLPNRPRECYTLARALHWESIDWMSEDAFMYRYNPSGYVNIQDEMKLIEKKGRLSELRARLRCNFMVRRLKKDVQKDLPDKRYEMLYVEPNGAIKEVLAKEKLIDFDPRDLTSPNFAIDGQIATVRREMGEAMAPRVVEHLKYLFEIVEIPKIVVFAHHRSVMEFLQEAMEDYGVCIVRGGMGVRAKQDSIDNFINLVRKRMFLGQMDTMIGVDGLQHVSSYDVFAEPAWNPGTNEQCVDRTHRIGQHDNVLAQFAVAEGSFNEMVLKNVVFKAINIHEVLDGGAR
jgi:SWI/SNF-related matrix-associated actin-dependent regulator 1 of chromatin subfamily A